MSSIALNDSHFARLRPEAPKRMPLRRAGVPQHDYTQLPNVPEWLKQKENKAYEQYALNPPPGHRPHEEEGALRHTCYSTC